MLFMVLMVDITEVWILIQIENPKTWRMFCVLVEGESTCRKGKREEDKQRGVKRQGKGEEKEGEDP